MQSVPEHRTSETVVWMSDDKAKFCLLCQTKFTPIKRKVHLNRENHNLFLIFPFIILGWMHLRIAPLQVLLLLVVSCYNWCFYRKCGRIYCHDCSSHKVVLAHLGYFKPERVCDECYIYNNGIQHVRSVKGTVEVRIHVQWILLQVELYML